MNAWNKPRKSKDYFISPGFLWQKYCLIPKLIEIWTPGNTAYSGQFHPTFISLVNVPWWLENKWCQNNRRLGLHVTSFLPCVAAIINPWHFVFRMMPWFHDTWCSKVRWREVSYTFWVPDPSCTKSCGQFKPWAMVAWARSVFGIPQSWRAQVNHALLLSLSPFSPGHT
jgi:hypothetical protein